METVTDEELTMIENRLNHRPRKRLGFKTPHEVFYVSLNRVAVQLNPSFNGACFLGVSGANMFMIADFFSNLLDQMIDLRHPLAVLANRMP
jgi:hypothetical protein